MLRKLLKMLLILLLVVGVYAAVLASEVLPRPTADELAAIELLRRPAPVPAGRSAFALLWFQQYDLGGRDPDALMREDVARLQAAGPLGEGFVSVAADFPKIASIQPDRFCRSDRSCLAFVRGLPDHGAALIQEHATLLQRLDALAGTEHLAYPFDVGNVPQTPPLTAAKPLLTQAAYRFVSESPEAGLGLACRDLATWRRLAPTADNLLLQRIVLVNAAANARLVGEMLTEWPAGQALPPTCADALAPAPAAATDPCQVWRGEFRWMDSGMFVRLDEQYRPDPVWLVRRIGINRAATARRTAQHLASNCSTVPAPPADPGWVARVFDPIGVEETAGLPGMAGYAEVFADDLDVVQSVRILEWLRTQPDPAAVFAVLPPDLLPRPPGLTYHDDTRTLRLRLRRPQDGIDSWTFALPPPQLPASPPAG